MTYKSIFCSMAVVALALLPAMKSEAQLIVDEPFDHPNGATFDTIMTTVNGTPTAWNGADVASTFITIANGDTGGDNGTSSLEFPGLADSSGGRIVVVGNAANDNIDMDGVFAPPISGDGTVLYYSFLVKLGAVGPDMEGNNGFGGFSTEGGDNGAMIRPHIQDFDLDGTIELYARWRRQEQIIRGDPPPETMVKVGADLAKGTTYFIVCKVVMVAGDANDELHMWLDPTPGGSEPPADAVQLSGQMTGDTGNDVDTTGIDGIRLVRSRDDVGDYEFDEYRLGFTWEEVTPSGAPPPVVLSVEQWRLND